jgi:prepilin-type N-terminal cleavage/methylation domain-containing protein
MILPPIIPSFCATAAVAPKKSVRAFTVLEMMVVMGIVAIMAVGITPMLSSIMSGQGIASTAYGVSEALGNARAYAAANNTYVWVGINEVDQTASSSLSPQPDGTGRVVLSAVASRDGSRIYDPSGDISSDWLAKTADGSRLTQISKLLQFDHAHLAGDLPTGSPGKGMERPLVDQAFRIGSSASSSVITFNYPLGATGSKRKHSFRQVIEFDPQGSARTFSGAQPTLARQIEVGLRPTKGNRVLAGEVNQAAVQIGGLSGAMTIYRP